MKTSDAEKQSVEAIAKLREMLKPGDTVYTILNHVSRSGMNQRISCVIGGEGKAVKNINWLVAQALDEPIKNRSGYVQDVGIAQDGCGMDMGFNLVYNLARALYKEGFVCCGEGCGSNDHSNEYKKYANFKGQKHTGDGGYALKHKWL